MNKEELEQYFVDHCYSTYERGNYDSFLKNSGFSFSIPSIHITGTNGKGSVANYLYQIYLAKGYKVGLFNSPYLTNVCEMISANNKQISDDELLSLFDEYRGEFEKYNLSSFEMQTIIAFEYFKRQKLDIVIIEVGMGGFIDATNIITPVLSIITSINFEHTAYLGASLSEIAYNKAGIIKRNVPVLTGKIDDSAMYAIRSRAKELEASVHVVEESFGERIVGKKIIFDYRPYSSLEINTKAMYEVKNASLAVEATKILEQKFQIDDESIRKGLLSKCLNCRFEYITDNLLLDGAHNPEAIENLVNTLQKVESRPIHVVFASFRDKNIDKMFNHLGLITNDLNLTTFNHKRAREEMDYFLYLADYKFNDNYKELISKLLSEYPNDLILVTGSLAFTGVVRDFIKNEK